MKSRKKKQEKPQFRFIEQKSGKGQNGLDSQQAGTSDWLLFSTCRCSSPLTSIEVSPHIRISTHKKFKQITKDDNLETKF